MKETSPLPSLPAPSVAGEPECIWPAGAELGEGTLWSQREQALYWIDILTPRLFWFRPADGARRAWQFDEEITAISERATAPGLILTLRRGFALFDTTQLPGAGAKPHYLHQPEPERTGNRFNDGKCDSRGRFWGGSMDFDCKAPTGALYRYDADGRCTKHDDGFEVTNGPTWSADGRTMYFNNTVLNNLLRLRLRHGSRHRVEPARVAPLSEARWLARRHDHRRGRPVVDRALGRLVRDLP